MSNLITGIGLSFGQLADGNFSKPLSIGVNFGSIVGELFATAKVVKKLPQFIFLESEALLVFYFLHLILLCRMC